MLSTGVYVEFNQFLAKVDSTAVRWRIIGQFWTYHLSPNCWRKSSTFMSKPFLTAKDWCQNYSLCIAVITAVTKVSMICYRQWIEDRCQPSVSLIWLLHSTLLTQPAVLLAWTAVLVVTGLGVVLCSATVCHRVLRPTMISSGSVVVHCVHRQPSMFANLKQCVLHVFADDT